MQDNYHEPIFIAKISSYYPELENLYVSGKFNNREQLLEEVNRRLLQARTTTEHPRRALDYSYFSKKLRGENQWSLAEVFVLCQICEIYDLRTLLRTYGSSEATVSDLFYPAKPKIKHISSYPQLNAFCEKNGLNQKKFYEYYCDVVANDPSLGKPVTCSQISRIFRKKSAPSEDMQRFFEKYLGFRLEQDDDSVLKKNQEVWNSVDENSNEKN